MTLVDMLERALAGTKLDRSVNVPFDAPPVTPQIEVVDEPTLAAARRLVDENPAGARPALRDGRALPCG